MKRSRVDIKKRIKKRIELRHQRYSFIEKENPNKNNVNKNAIVKLDKKQIKIPVLSRTDQIILRKNIAEKSQKKQIKISALSGTDRTALRANISNIFPKVSIQEFIYNKLIDENIDKEILELDYDICVVITTYNREDFLHRLLDDIEKNKLNYKILILVFDDASNKPYEMLKYNVEYVRYSTNHGKWHYWKLITDTMEVCKHIKSKYFVYLPDDVTLVDDFFMKSIIQYENIKDDNKICLSLLMTIQQIGKKNWTNFIPIDYNEDIYKTQWCDLCFISERKLFENLNYKISQISETRWYNKRIKTNREFLSSGVGEDLSKRLHKMGCGMYHIKNSLVLHGDHESVMNYDKRKDEKLTT
jgi:hypothetical protein